MLVLVGAALAVGAPLPDTIRIEGRPAYVVSRREVLALEADTVRARLPWTASPGLSPVAACEGPDRGLVVLDASRGGRIVHLSSGLRTVSIHPLPGSLRAPDLTGSEAVWEKGRGLVLTLGRPPRRWLLGHLSGAPRELPPTDSVNLP